MHVSKSVTRIAHGSQKRGSEPLELESQTTVNSPNPCVDAGNPTQVWESTWCSQTAEHLFSPTFYFGTYLPKLPRLASNLVCSSCSP